VATQLAPPEPQGVSEPAATANETPAAPAAPAVEESPAPSGTDTEHKDGNQSPPAATS
jgi:hypothetical protein